MPLDFSPYQAVLLDLDGTVYHEDHALPGAVELIRRLQDEQRTFACLSNSSASPARIQARLQLMGVDVDAANIYTAAAATCDYVLEKFSADGRLSRLFNLATESVDELLRDRVEWAGNVGEPCDAIIVGPPSSVFCTEPRQRLALQLARAGSAAVVGICADRVYPSPRGIEFGAGAMTWMLSYAANVEPVFCGKPERIFFHELCRRLNVNPEWCLLIGDNLESDVIGGKAVGMRTILTLSGVTRESDLGRVKPELHPDLVVHDLRELA